MEVSIYDTSIFIMRLELNRSFKGPKYTIGHLYINGEYFCDTIEDVDRGLLNSMPLDEIKSKKIYGETAIPRGTYEVIINYSPKFKRNMPLIKNVKGYEGIRIHAGNTEVDSLGCIVVGENKIKGKVINSKNIFNKLYERLEKAVKNKELIKISIF